MPLPHKTRNLLILLVSLGVIGLVLGFGLRKTVTLSVEGESQTITTYAFKVADLLYAQNISISPDDRLTPTKDAWLNNGDVITLVRAAAVQILADGAITSLYSPERVPASLLEQAGVRTQPGDLVLSNGQKVDVEQSLPSKITSISLQVIRSIRFTLTENNVTKTITSTAPTLGSALWAAGYSLYANDLLNPPANTPLSEGLKASLTRSRQVTIHTQAGDIPIRTTADTVGAALEAAQLSLQGLDYSMPAADQAIPADGKVRLVRVTEQVIIEETPIAFETEYQPISDLELDTQSIVQAGGYGMTAERVRVRYEDGVEASRKVESEWVAREPEMRIIGYGTLPVMHTESVDGRQIQYWRKLSMYATSYHPAGVGDTTASGLPLEKGVAAVDTRLVPFFTKMYVPGYGEAIAADIGGGVIGRWIDLGYSDSDYVAWHSWVTVYFLWPPPDNIVWVIP